MFEHRPFGHSLKLSVRGASHAPSIGFTLANFPRGERIDFGRLRAFMSRRAPGRDNLSTARKEADEVKFVSGLSGGVTTGGEIEGHIANTDRRPGDYGEERTVPRPGHADFGQWIEQGRIPTGGGANSGRLTAALCAAGGICLQSLARRGVTVSAAIDTVGGRKDGFAETIAAARDDGDSVGGTIRCEVTGLKPGLGGALFAGIESELSAALFAIPGVNGVEFGNGFAASSLKGSENDDSFVVAENGEVRTETNRQGGVLGGRTSGMPLQFRISMKPTPTVFKPLPSVELSGVSPSRRTVCQMKGRHDPCIVRRAVPVVEAVAAFVLFDQLLAAERSTPRICLTLTGRTIEEDFAQYETSRYFTDMVELRLDLLREATYYKWFPVPVLLTCRRKCDGGEFAGTESERAELMSRALAEAHECGRDYAFVDLEDDFRDEEFAALARRLGVRIVRSRHDFSGTPSDPASLCRAMVRGTDEIAKLAVTPRTASDLLSLFEAGRELADVPHVLCSMGAAGAASRTLAARSGSLWTYSSVGGLSKLGHLTPFELVRDYRLRVQTGDFTLFGVTGWPLSMTRSPEIHNAAFAAADTDAVMASFPAATVEEALAIMRGLGLRGMAVTIPHKERIMPLLDRISPEAKAIGAVNTVSLENGELVGYNTDADGFAEAFLAFVSRSDDGVDRDQDVRALTMRVAVLGAGGASKAVVYALRRLGATVEVFHRATPPQGFDAIVNATPVDPIPDYVFTGREFVYDLTYAQELTPLLSRAHGAGCPTENGFSMLRAQARRQRQIWGVE